MTSTRNTPPKAAPRSGAGARVALVGLLVTLVVVWFATIPMRQRLARETAKYNKQAERAQADQARAEQMRKSVDQLNARLEQTRQAVATNPNDAQMRLQYGALLVTFNRATEAEAQFQAAVDLAPNSAENRALLADFYDHQNKLDLAIDNYKQALNLDGRNVRALKGLAFRYVSLGWNQQAESLLQRAVQEQPNEVRLHVALGLAAFQIDNMKRAEKELLAAIRLTPDDPTLYPPLIEVYRLGHRSAEALKTIDAAEPKVQDKVMLHIERILVYLGAGDFDKVLAEAETTLKLDPENVRAHYYRGLTLRRKGDAAKAAQDFEWVYRHQPDFEMTRLMLGQLWIQQGRTEDGKRLVTEMTKTSDQAAERSRLMLNVGLKPTSAETHAKLGANYFKMGQYARAIVELKRAVELQPTDRASRELLVKALDASGRGAEARRLGRAG